MKVPYSSMMSRCLLLVSVRRYLYPPLSKHSSSTCGNGQRLNERTARPWVTVFAAAIQNLHCQILVLKHLSSYTPCTLSSNDHWD
ncbi:hypothetical protein BaRGS_00026094 [Batillaria attramentaria]|uniref:Secreted protein n=1 Tax=Batillaria attramentaria TaxID=370345 RepID=A0ABD0K777_9CAEN